MEFSFLSIIKNYKKHSQYQKVGVKNKPDKYLET